MSSAAPPAEPTQPAPADDDRYFRAILREMTERGMRLIRQAEADATLTLEEKVDIFDRVSRAVRRAILLEQHLATQPKRPASAPPAPRPTTDADIARANRTEPPDRAERGERRERVETGDRIADLLARPLPEILAAIEQDLRPIHPAPPLDKPALKVSSSTPRPAASPAPHPILPDPRIQPPHRGPPPDPLRMLRL